MSKETVNTDKMFKDAKKRVKAYKKRYKTVDFRLTWLWFAISVLPALKELKDNNRAPGTIDAGLEMCEKEIKSLAEDILAELQAVKDAKDKLMK